MTKHSDDHLHIEEDYHKQGKRSSRHERKRRTEKDRSNRKKTDREKRPPPPTDPDQLRGRVLAITADGMLVSVDERLYLCRLKGSLKQEKKQVKNLIAIGDWVLVKPTTHEEGTITYIEERHSILSRIDPLSEHCEQLIAVNIDQVLITASVLLPALKPYLIDRYIIAARKGKMNPIILLNKIDYFNNPPDTVDQNVLDEEKALFDATFSTYKNLPIPILALSTKTGEGIDELKTLMQNKTSVFSGQSGTGKSSLINATLGATLLTGAIIHKTQKGSHTTTQSHLLPLPQGGFCIDTPGIRSFGLWDISAEEVQDHYQEISALRPHCRFPNCMHLEEPDCAVKAAAQDGAISPLRFASYCALMQSIKEKFRRR